MSGSLIPPPTAPPAPPQSSSTDGQSGRVTSVPQQLAQLPRPVTLTGQVIAHNNDGTVSVQTAQGTINVALRGQSTPPDGQAVEIDLAAGRPPRTAVIRPADPSQLTSASTAAETETANLTNAMPAGAPPGSNSLLADAATTSATAESLPPAPPETLQAMVQPGDSVRLLPLAPDTPIAIPPAAAAQSTRLDTPPPLMPATTGGQTTTAGPLQVQTAWTAPLMTTAILSGDTSPLATPAAPPVSTALPPATALASNLPIGTAAPPAISMPELRLLDVRIAALTAPAPSFTAPAATPATTSSVIQTPLTGSLTASTLPATVVGSIDQPGVGALPVIALSLPGRAMPALFVMQVPASNLPPGTQLLLAPEFAAAAPQSATPSLPDFQWNSLTSVHAALEVASPAQAAALAAMLPSPASPEMMPAAALLFIAALRARDLGSWLGDDAASILRDDEDGAPALEKLAGDISGLARLDSPLANADTGDWRAIALPLLWQGEVQKLALHYRHDRSGQKSGKPERPRGTRFMCDLRLSRMGPVQLDGLHRPADRDSRLDLIVRTRAPLSATMQAAMRLTYTRALESCEHTGEMSFQYRAEQFVSFR